MDVHNYSIYWKSFNTFEKYLYSVYSWASVGLIISSFLQYRCKLVKKKKKKCSQGCSQDFRNTETITSAYCKSPLGYSILWIYCRLIYTHAILYTQKVSLEVCDIFLTVSKPMCRFKSELLVNERMCPSLRCFYQQLWHRGKDIRLWYINTS